MKRSEKDCSQNVNIWEKKKKKKLYTSELTIAERNNPWNPF